MSIPVVTEKEIKDLAVKKGISCEEAEQELRINPNIRISFSDKAKRIRASIY
jgi:hypothetical protein